MKAVQYRTIGSRPEVVDIPVPSPGPGQVLLKMTAAGVCHSDEFVMSLPTFEGLPLTLGHEAAGTVESTGEGVYSVQPGEAVVVYGPRGCGRCHTCSLGRENYCPYARELGIHPPGLGAPGAMSEYFLVENERLLVPLGDLDPIANVALTDAGLTPYHAIKSLMPSLIPGSTAVVIGTGGLGHLAIQILRALTPATVIALDVNEEKLSFAAHTGAHHALLSNADASRIIRDLTEGKGAEVILDFVGATPTLKIAAESVAQEGDISIVGIGGAALPTGFGFVPYGTRVHTPYWGTRSELFEVLNLARSGQLKVEVETFSLDEAPLAYERLRAGTLRGRAVIVPGATT
ncbi:NAD(P)-dependent alcohol dehydrogenase [Lysinibacter sp. HNR]|uniref:NAD(P)-dependent alcohol dehydrogenase n=1 Tax=Lysinibacter sp. HNR TaxID=3031408 RepID=UPI002435F40A|nr:NAD(P)-dependent alcohol dehydrogenase [Lysinibacter sp. HNR]WGD36248.1 NAD(P)-dependent alcohol dehydrogenase [Lysinibacter sp. HNR]